MRCKACDRLLTDFESTRKSEVTGDYVDLCSHCYSSISADLLAVPMAERADLAPIAETERTDQPDESLGHFRSEPRLYSDED